MTKPCVRPSAPPCMQMAIQIHHWQYVRPSDNLHSARAHSRAQARAAVDAVGASLVLD